MPDTANSIEKVPEPAYTPHPCTALFPPMSPEQEADFVADIERNGLREPILVDLHGRIVDGVHRYRACAKLGIKPEVDARVLTDAEAWAFSISRNLYRRHLSEATRAAISAEARKAANLPVTQAEAAKAFNISERTQRSAEAVLGASVDLHQAVKNGELSVHAAEQIAKLPAAERAAAIHKVKQGDAKGARALAKVAHTEATTKSKGADKKAAKSIAKDAGSAEVKTSPVAKKTRSATPSASNPKRSSRTAQGHEFRGHADYALLFTGLDILFGELPKLPGYRKVHPLTPVDAQYLDAKLRKVIEQIEHAIKE